MEALVSIITPVYNRERYIEECVQSVLVQSWQNFEMILVDDGSADRSLEICRELSQKDPRIVLLAAEHVGVSAARNRALAVAKGEYVFFLDSDDAVHPGLVEALVRGMEGTNAAISGTLSRMVNNKVWHRVAEDIRQEQGPAETTLLSHQETLDAVFHTMTPLNVITGVMMRRDYIGQTRFRTDLHIGEDFFFIYENLIKGTDTVFLKQKWYYSRIHDRNLSWDYSFAGFYSRFRRRMLVAESEERLGRRENADSQKRDSFHSYLSCMKHHKPGSPDSKQMRSVIKQHRKILFPVLSKGDKLRYFLSVYAPGIYLPLERLMQKWKAH